MCFSVDDLNNIQVSALECDLEKLSADTRQIFYCCSSGLLRKLSHTNFLKRFFAPLLYQLVVSHSVMVVEITCLSIFIHGFISLWFSLCTSQDFVLRGACFTNDDDPMNGYLAHDLSSF